MAYRYYSHNGEILPIENAVVPLARVEYSYGFGVYESVRVAKNTTFFLDEHCQRLMRSAEIIGLGHNFSEGFVAESVRKLLKSNDVEACNIKILLTGGRTEEDASLDILCLNPLFPNRKLYKTGSRCVSYRYEREFPGAKTLNMLSSYLAYRQATAAGAYDALLINSRGYVTEGTRTNFFGLKGRTIVSAPADEILPGVTRAKVLEVAKQNGFDISEKDIKLDDVQGFDNVFLTSTSSKIMPINAIDDFEFEPLSPALNELMQAYNDFLSEYAS